MSPPMTEPTLNAVSIVFGFCASWSAAPRGAAARHAAKSVRFMLVGLASWHSDFHPEQDVLKVVQQMFDGMRNADSAAVRRMS